jgi:nicotinate-nucleotide pyrophosphorylase (carboxylating)
MRGPVELPPARAWRDLIELALEEDVGPGDVTTTLLVPEERSGEAVIEARQPLIVCGLAIAEAVFRTCDPALALEPCARDGAEARGGERLAVVRGPLRGILTAERTALNFLMRLCGVASFTRRFAEAVRGTGAAIVDTRKTLPGWRVLDKYATAVGGAENHRLGLFDGILIKDNHVALAGDVALAVKSALAGAPANLRVQVEVESEEQALAAVAAGADFLLLDNCTPARMRAIAGRLQGRALLEASGGVDLDNVREIAESGVQRISIGALTHSAPAVDIALELSEPSTRRAPGGATSPGGVTA